MKQHEAKAAAAKTAAKKTSAKTKATGTKAAGKQDGRRTPADRRPLAELDLLDDFLFGAVVSYPEIGERFVRILLRTIFGREFRHLSVTSQKMFYGADTHLHGARLDVYLEPTEIEESGGRATVYDIDPDLKDRAADKRALPRRTRFYHGKIAARSLNAGADYDTLKDVVVVMILPYDPFGLGRMVYTVRSRCVEVPEMEYDDGAGTLFLYTKGTAGVPSEELRQLLRYMEQTIYENAVSEELREIHEMVGTVKRDSEVGRVHIQMLEDIRKQAREITRQEKEITRQEKEIATQAETITRQAQENASLTEENIRQAQEIQRLQAIIAQADKAGKGT